MTDARKRFDEKWVPEPNTGCWLWCAATNQYGYGIFAVWPKYVSAHRLSWEMRHGKIADGLCVLHKCDTPACVNPNHLFLGTQKDNMRDMASKGRSTKGRPGVVRGTRHGMSKLTPADVREARYLLRKGYTKTEIGNRLGVSRSAIADLAARRTWRHVT